MKTVCVDFNGVLDLYQGWNGPGTEFRFGPRPGVEAFLTALARRGYRIVVLTAAEPRVVEGWLRANGLDGLVDDVTNKKPPALAYIDDRGITFRGDYEETLRELDAFRAHWEQN